MKRTVLAPSLNDRGATPRILQSRSVCSSIPRASATSIGVINCAMATSLIRRCRSFRHEPKTRRDGLGPASEAERGIPQLRSEARSEDMPRKSAEKLAAFRPAGRLIRPKRTAPQEPQQGPTTDRRYCSAHRRCRRKQAIDLARLSRLKALPGRGLGATLELFVLRVVVALGRR